MRTEKLLLLLACALIVILIALAGWQIQRSAVADAGQQIAQRLRSAGQMQMAQQALRSRELLLVTRQLAGDRGFVGYVAQSLRQDAGGAVDSASIRDLLDERRQQLDIDMAMVLNSSGRTIVDTTAYQPTQSDLSRHPAVGRAMSTLEPASGYLRGRERLMAVAVAPLLLGSGSEGLLLCGEVIDDAMLREVGAIAASDLALVAATPDGIKVLAGTLDANARRDLAAIAAQRNWPGAAQADETLTLRLGEADWLLQAQPVAAGDTGAGTLVVLLPSTAVDAMTAATRRQLLLAGALLAGLVLLLAAVVWWRTLRPLDRLAQVSRRIAAGDLEPVPAAGSGGIAGIGAALRRLTGELRETRDFETYSGELLRQRTRSSETAVRSTPAAAVDHGAAARLTAGNLLADRYEIYARVGSGQYGVVYRALDRQHGEVVALKLLGPAALADAAHAARVKELLRAGARVQHANVARLRDVGQVDGMIYIASEYVRGISLKEALARTGRIPLYAALHVARQICAGLAAIHAAATAHGALHPSNIVLTPGADTKLLDIGQIPPPPGFDRHRPETPLRSDPTYLSPQQILGQLATQQDDVYALGLILTEVFTARLPQPNGNPGELCTVRIERDPVAPSRLWTEIPAPIETLLLHCIERDPARRLTSAVAVLAELERCRL